MKKKINSPDQPEHVIGCGYVRIEAFDVHTGQRVDLYEGKNLLVAGAALTVSRILGGDPAGRPITKIGVGTNSTPPAPGDTGLSNPFIKSIDGVAYPDAKSLRISWSLNAGEANGISITELGLFTDNNTLFARKAREPIAKTSNIRLVGTWLVVFNS